MSGVSDLDRLAEFVRQDHRAVQTWPLVADGRFQIFDTSLDRLTSSVSKHIQGSIAACAGAPLPTLYCAWGKARVGSTALANLFGVAGLPSFYQPIKTTLRYQLTGAPAPIWQLQQGLDGVALFCKDVAGPYLLAECLYVPLQILIEAGYPADRIHLVMLDRDPVATFSSWLRKFGDRVPGERLVEHFVLASLNGGRVAAYAARQGVPVTHYVHEASRDPVGSIRALFARLGLGGRFTQAAVTDWTGQGQLGGPGARLIRADQPAAYALPGIHGTETGYGYRRAAVEAVTDAHRALIARHGLDQAYRASAEACRHQLGLDAALLAA